MGSTYQGIGAVSSWCLSLHPRHSATQAASVQAERLTLAQRLSAVLSRHKGWLQAAETHLPAPTCNLSVPFSSSSLVPRTPRPLTTPSWPPVPPPWPLPLSSLPAGRSTWQAGREEGMQAGTVTHLLVQSFCLSFSIFLPSPSFRKILTPSFSIFVPSHPPHSPPLASRLSLPLFHRPPSLSLTLFPPSLPLPSPLLLPSSLPPSLSSPPPLTTPS